jgi:hypothetical protein
MTLNNVPLIPPTFGKTPMGLDDPFDFLVKLHSSYSKYGEYPK